MSFVHEDNFFFLVYLVLATCYNLYVSRILKKKNFLLKSIHIEY